MSGVRCGQEDDGSRVQPNVALAGPMGAGKTTVGRLLAGRLGRPFVDTDTLIVVSAGMSVPELFAERGEEAFRVLEAGVVAEVCKEAGQVIALGGGAVTYPPSVAVLRERCHVIALSATPEALADRVAGEQRAGQRPLLDGVDDVAGRLRALIDERQAAYEAAAHAVVDTTDRPLEQVVDVITAWLEEQE